MGTDTMLADVMNETKAPLAPLSAKDRCDTRSCGARAYVHVGHADSFTFLSFCGHHYHDNELKLMAAGFAVVEDIREDLLLKSSDIVEAIGA